MNLNLSYNIAVNEDGEGAISLVVDGTAHTIQHDHPSFTNIADALLKGEDPTRWLDIQAPITQLDERVSIQDNVVYFDGEVVNDVLTRQILRFHREGRDPSGLVRFLERIQDNPSRRAREVLFKWVDDRDLTITPDGTFIGWKGVGDDMRSKFSGDAFVDGVEYKGQQIPNEVGSVVSMPRTEVMDDPNSDCSYGLHVGTYNYAKGFGSVLLEVEVGPEHVVSVPSGSESWKIRTCEYTVLRIHGGETDQFDEEYEAPATYSDPGLDPLAVVVPETFLARLRTKWITRRTV